MLDVQHTKRNYFLSEVDHDYGDHVHIISDPVSLTMLARVCSRQTGQPVFNDLVEEIYRRLLTAVINQEFPLRRARFVSRMAEILAQEGEDAERGVIEGEMLDPATRVVTVDIARAGILPSLTCYRFLNEVLEPQNVRQDHLIVSRALDSADRVVGARIAGEKIGGPIDGRIVLFPDPMGATGSSLSAAIRFYKENYGGQPAKLVTLNLIVTPEYIRRLREDHPEAVVYAVRLDRGMSPPEVLNSKPGSRWEEESGLNEHGYIVPGGGGFGELMNNAWV